MPTEQQMVPVLEEPSPSTDCEQQQWGEKTRNDAQEWTRPVESPVIWRESALDISIELVRMQLRAEVARAGILELEDNWDGEGSPSYSLDTVDRAIEFAATQARVLRDFARCLPMPEIGAGPDGSIDLHWKLPSRELLVNIPADANEVATYYGDDYKTQKIRGSVNARNLNWGIAEWLMS